jgi:signal transduction histidine kinase
LIQPLAAAIALAAFGALFAGSALLLLIAPGRRGVRWWVGLQATIMVWLLLQGWGALGGDAWFIGPGIHASVFLLPAVFVAFAMMEATARPTRDALLVLGLGAIALLAETSLRPYSYGVLTALWHAAGWGIGSWILFGPRLRKRDEPASSDPTRPRTLVLVVALMAIVAPAALVGGFVLGSRMWIYFMPLLVVWLQLLVFFGVARLRFYDVEVRARRTGEIATRAAEQERLAVLGELSATLAHEIRNPLTGVRSLAQRLAEEAIDEDRRRRYAAVILQEVERVERLVASLLGLARRPDGGTGTAPFALHELLGDLELLLASRAAAAGVRLEMDAGGVTAHARRDTVAQALLNLLLNAIAHAPSGSVVRVAVHTVAGDAGGLEIVVADRGAGIAPGERETVWEPFRSGSGGTGLGLAVVRRLAREHGWAAELRDREGGGTEAVLRLPSPAAGPTVSRHDRQPAPGAAAR